LIFKSNDATLVTVSTLKKIDPNITMGDLLKEYPGAQRALFRAYHIGGCSNCGFSPNESLSGLCARNENLPVDEVISTILAGQEADDNMKISPSEIAERLKRGEQIPLVDVRSREEWDAVRIDGSIFFTQELMQKILSEWHKEREFVFYCHHGLRSLDAASFFVGHGFQKVRSMTGGIDAWSVEVNPDLPRYHLE
jgi:rhodanese-related sulfurtransferase